MKVYRIFTCPTIFTVTCALVFGEGIVDAPVFFSYFLIKWFVWFQTIRPPQIECVEFVRLCGSGVRQAPRPGALVSMTFGDNWRHPVCPSEDRGREVLSLKEARRSDTGA